MPGVRPGMVELTPSRGSKLTMILNKEPDRTLGVGGFVSVERALRRPGKFYKSIPDDEITLDCTIDIDEIGGPAVERRIEVLRNMGLAMGEDEPPTIKLDGDVWDNDKSLDWVIKEGGISLGPRLWQSDGTLRRQQLTVALERMNALSSIEPIQLKRTRSTGSRKRRSRVVVTRASDTLRAVSLRELGDATRWKEIQAWNKTKLKRVDPDARLRTGTHLRIR